MEFRAFVVKAAWVLVPTVVGGAIANWLFLPYGTETNAGTWLLSPALRFLLAERFMPTWLFVLAPLLIAALTYLVASKPSALQVKFVDAPLAKASPVLEDIQWHILRTLTFRDNRWVTAQDMAGSQLTLVGAQHELNRLKRAGFLMDQLHSGSPTRYRMNESGLAFAVENGLANPPKPTAPKPPPA